MKKAGIIMLGALAFLAVAAYGVALPEAEAAQVCSQGSCMYVACNQAADCGNDRFTGAQFCQGNSIYQNYFSYTCLNPGTAQAACVSSINPRLQQTCSNSTCKYGSCVGSLAPEQGGQTVIQTTGQSTYTPPAQTTTCTQNASKKCISNISYWHDSCGNVQSIYKNCNSTGQVCQAGECVAKQPAAPSTPAAPYVKHYQTKCNANGLYWYDSRGKSQETYQSCDDNNSCTVDTCEGTQCLHALKCDGSTCANTTQDFAKYCGGASKGLAVSMFANNSSDVLQWQKSINSANNGKINFLLTVKNNSDSPVPSVSVKADIPGSIAYTGNLKIDNVQAAGSVTAGLDLGTIQGREAKVITFSGQAQAPNTMTAQVVAQAASENISDTDTIAVNITGSQTAGASDSAGGFWLLEFIKRWYIWIIIIVILIVLFVIIFRRLSTSD